MLVEGNLSNFLPGNMFSLIANLIFEFYLTENGIQWSRFFR